MATDWFYYVGDRRMGPVGSKQLKDLARTGQLQPTDFIWKEGMANPQPAAKLSGLFEAASTAPPHAEVPPPQPSSAQSVTQPKQAGLVESLKTAGNLAAKQADLSRIKSVSLPAAFQKLGKSVFEDNFGRAELTAEYAAVDDLRSQITARIESAKSATTPQGFAQQAKALAKATTDAAQTKLLQVRLAQAITRLGQSAYERRMQIALPQQLVDGVEAVHRNISELEAAIKKLGEEKPGQAIKHSLATEGSALWRSLLNNCLVQVCLIPFCGLGLFLIFRSPSWSRRAKFYWAGGVAGWMVIGTVINIQERNAMTTALTEANSLWDDKKAAEAIDKYGVILGHHWSRLDESDRSTLIRRVVEFDVRSGNEAAAKELLQKVVANHVAVTFDDERANRLQQSVIAEAEEKKKREAEAATASGKSSAADSTSADKHKHEQVFSDRELRVIDSDPNLRIVRSLGHLDSQKLERYLQMQRAYESTAGDDNWTDVGSRTIFLMMIPAQDWFRAGKLRGWSREDFRGATNFVISISAVDKGYDPSNRTQYEAVLLKLTGKHLSEY